MDFYRIIGIAKLVRLTSARPRPVPAGFGF